MLVAGGWLLVNRIKTKKVHLLINYIQRIMPICLQLWGCTSVVGNLDFQTEGYIIFLINL